MLKFNCYNSASQLSLCLYFSEFHLLPKTLSQTSVITCDTESQGWYKFVMCGHNVDVIWVLAFICGHLHERVEGHRKKTSSICKHYTCEHNGIIPERLLSSLASWLNAVTNLIALLNKCQNFMSSLNVQSDSLPAKVFT